MKKKKVKVGLAPTRRRVFSVEDSLKYKGLIEEKLSSWEVDFVNLDSLNKEGLLFDRLEAKKAAKIFIDAGVDAVFGSGAPDEVEVSTPTKKPVTRQTNEAKPNNKSSKPQKVVTSVRISPSTLAKLHDLKRNSIEQGERMNIGDILDQAVAELWEKKEIK